MAVHSLRLLLAVFLGLMVVGSGKAEIVLWKLGGSGLSWSDSDSLQVMVDFESVPGAIQPVNVTSNRTVFSFLSNWSPTKDPVELGYVDGERPRAWKGGGGSGRSDVNGINLIDGDGTTYNPVTSNSIGGEYYTIDLGVPVPAFRFVMLPPDEGFYRSDGLPLNEDAVPAYEISIAADNNDAVNNSSGSIGEIISEERENVNPIIVADFSKQYVRVLRYKRNNSILDEFSNASQSHSGLARKGTVADFELFGEGIPKRAVYKTKIFNLGNEVNFGRLFWSITPMRMVDGEAVEAPDAKVSVQVEARTGVNEIPEIYYEYTDMETRVAVDRDRYEKVLKNQSSPVTNADGLGNVVVLTQTPKPGLRAGIEYDQENWTFWSFPILESGKPLNLNRGSNLQLKIILHSESFEEFARLDSIWIETSPILATQVVAEISRLDDPQPARGVAEVSMGETTDFIYDIKADLRSGEQGFDAFRIRTGNPQTVFKSLEIGGERAEPEQVKVEDGALVIHLSERVRPSSNRPLRVIFATEVFDFARTFEGQVFNIDSADLPQPIEGADASEALSTNSLRVLAASTKNPELIQDLSVSTSVLTPNGDGINDELEVSYTLFGLPQDVPLELTVFSLDGRQIAAIEAVPQGSGPQVLKWDGRSRDGEMLMPGLYLLGIAVKAESNSSQQLRPIGIAY